ncbi:hypothetical protein [Streptomyces sp. NPDC048001]|uniref:hypothetical protein n=1 Tax=unclassified Streptomyces TaxID=2593676 RepID=UPI003724A9A0
MALLGGIAVADPAPPAASKPKSGVTLTVGGGESAQHIITCALFANKPNYSGGIITATGGMSGCVPSTPEGCASEVDLQVYLSGPGVWSTAAASTRQTRCPPPARSTTARMNCDSDTTSWSYRTDTLASICHDGTTDSNTSTSAVLSVKCG